MKILKIALAIAALIILVPLVAALFIKKEFSIEREVTINKPKPQVLGYVKLVQNSIYYNHWWMIDPNATHEFKGTDGTVGFIATWDSKNKNMGKGEQEITKITDDMVAWELRFKKPFEGIANTYMIAEPVSENQTKVKWVFSGAHPYPMNFMNMFMDNMLGGDLEKSLRNLKTILDLKQ
jgi:hypothetical protein